jgi:thiamine kinase-like enzyme
MIKPPELESYLHDKDERVLSIERINKRESFPNRLALKVVFEGWHIIKARWLPSESQAADWHRIRADIGAKKYLSACLHRKGRMVVEEWVEGEILDMKRPENSSLVSAAKILAKIHALEIPNRGFTPPLDEQISAEANIKSLVQHGAITSEKADEIVKILMKKPPVETFKGLTHYDFCGENLVHHPERGIVSIDHEWMCLSSVEFDLGRAICRWGLEGESKDVFIEAYKKSGGVAEIDSIEWWTVVNRIFAAEIRVRRGWKDARESIHQLLTGMETCQP